MPQPQPTIVANYHCTCGEGPLWHPDEGVLYWVDIPKGRLFCYDPASGEHEQLKEGRHLGATTIQADGSLLLMGEGCYVSTWRDGVETDIIAGIEGETRFNDAIADPEGRVFSGSMPHDGWKDDPDKAGKLYRIDPDGTYHVMDRGFGCANGLAFTADLKTLLFCDSPSQNIYAYDYDRATGGLSNRRVYIATAGEGSVPDGMTLDSGGHLWSARWNGRCVVHYDETGREVERITMPTDKITSAAFGGDGLETMYITSAGGGAEGDSGGTDEAAGALFSLRVKGATGVPEYRSRIGL